MRGALRLSPLVAVLVAMAAVAEPAKGIQLGYNVSYEESDRFPLAVESGADHVRVVVPWGAIEPAPGEYHWRALDLVNAEITEAGLRPLLVLTDAPCWARPSTCGADIRQGTGIELRHASEFPPGVAAHPNPVGLRPQFAPDPQYEVAWRGFVAQVAARFPHTILQLWNEPNLRMFCFPECSPKRYTRFAKQGYLGARDAGFPGPIIGAGIAPVEASHPRAYARKLRSLGIRRWVDAVGVHIYPGIKSGDPRRWADITAAWVRRMRERLGVRVWVTELAVWSTETRQARALAGILRRLERLREVRGMSIYRLSDTPGVTFPRSGVLHADGTPKPAWFRLRRQMRRFGASQTWTCPAPPSGAPPLPRPTERTRWSMPRGGSTASTTCAP
jgi:polysaccharide biosynthesis protein PslG